MEFEVKKLKFIPYHEASSKVTGPVSSGECLDCNIGKAGLSHPIAEPWLKAIMFARKCFSFGELINKSYRTQCSDTKLLIQIINTKRERSPTLMLGVNCVIHTYCEVYNMLSKSRSRAFYLSLEISNYLWTDNIKALKRQWARSFPPDFRNMVIVVLRNCNLSSHQIYTKKKSFHHRDS